MKRYLGLLAVGVALSMGALMFGRAMTPARSVGLPSTTSSVVSIDLTITPDYRVIPPVTAVPKDHLVKLTVRNHYRLPVSLTLMGYQGRFAAAYVPTDSVWSGEFLADRPGEDFAWLLEGAPAGRLQVVGSHLVDGHR